MVAQTSRKFAMKVKRRHPVSPPLPSPLPDTAFWEKGVLLYTCGRADRFSQGSKIGQISPQRAPSAEGTERIPCYNPARENGKHGRLQSDTTNCLFTRHGCSARIDLRAKTRAGGGGGPPLAERRPTRLGACDAGRETAQGAVSGAKEQLRRTGFSGLCAEH